MAELAPCGTPAAARRHQRAGEPCCGPCLDAMARERADREGSPSARRLAPAPLPRNGLPEVPRYRWRARAHETYEWAQRNIFVAEAEHGSPEPTCVCGRRAVFRDGRIIRCACGLSPGDIYTGGDR